MKTTFNTNFSLRYLVVDCKCCHKMSDTPISDRLSIVAIILIIAICILTGLVAMFLIKRHIRRLSMRSGRRPHMAIGAGVPATFRHTIENKLEKASKIKYEPQLLSTKVQENAETTPNNYLYRMKAVDSFKLFDDALEDMIPSAKRRHPNKSVRQHLMELYPEYVNLQSTKLIHQFSDAYENARHSPEIFGQDQYEKYMALLRELIQSLKPETQPKEAVTIRHKGSKDTQVIFKPDKKASARGGAHELKAVPDTAQAGAVRLRSRAESSTFSSYVDSGNSSHHSSESVQSIQLRSHSQEKINLLELDKHGRFI